MDDDVPALEQPAPPHPAHEAAPQLDYRAFAGFGTFGGLSHGGAFQAGGQRLLEGRYFRVFSGGTLVVPFDNDKFLGGDGTEDAGITTVMLIPDGGVRFEPFTHWVVSPTLGATFGYALVLLFDQTNPAALPGIGQAITVTLSVGATYHASDKLQVDLEASWRPIWLDASQPSTLTAGTLGVRF